MIYNIEENILIVILINFGRKISRRILEKKTFQLAIVYLPLEF